MKIKCLEFVVRGFCLLVILLSLYSCQGSVADKISGADCIKELDKTGKLPSRLLVLNEGNFQWGLSTMQVFQWNDTGSIRLVNNDLYQCQRQTPMGNIGQSFYLDTLQDYLFAIINNSGKIVVWKYSTLEFVGEIKGLTSPRYMVRVGDSYLVSDLYSGNITIISTKNWASRSSLRVFGWIEEMNVIASKGLVLASRVARTGQNQRLNALLLLKYNNNQLNIIDSLILESGLSIVGRPIVGGNFERVGLYCSSKLSTKDSLVTVSVQGDSLRGLNSYGILLSGKLGETKRLIVSSNQNDAFVIANEAYHVTGLYDAVTSNDFTGLSTSKLGIPMSHGVLYGGLILSPARNDVLGFVADAGRYVSNGKLYIISRNGEVINGVETGVIPQAMIE